MEITTVGDVTATVPEATSLDAARKSRNVLLKDAGPYCLRPGGTIDRVTRMSMGGWKGSIREVQHGSSGSQTPHRAQEGRGTSWRTVRQPRAWRASSTAGQQTGQTQTG